MSKESIFVAKLLGQCIAAIPGGFGFYFILNTYFIFNEGNFVSSVLSLMTGMLLVNIATKIILSFNAVADRLDNEDGDEKNKEE